MFINYVVTSVASTIVELRDCLSVYGLQEFGAKPRDAKA